MSLQAKPNDIYQADMLYLPRDKYEKKIYKFALNMWMLPVGTKDPIN